MNNPNSVEDVGTFEINTYEVYESVQYLIDSGTADDVYTAEPNQITSGLSLSASSYETNYYPTTYTVTFTPASYIEVGGIIKITVPIADIEIYSESQTEQDTFVTLGDDTPFAAALTADASTGLITITNAFSARRRLRAWDPDAESNPNIAVSIGYLKNPGS